MDNIETYYGEVFPIEETICKDCIYRMSRMIIPLDPESFGIDEEDLEDMGLKEDEDIIMEQHTCLITGQDMDFLVKACTKYNSIETEISLFKNNPYV